MRYELNDYEWSIIRPMLPNKLRGVPRVDDRRISQWHLLGLALSRTMARPAHSYGPTTTCYNRFVRWRRAGVCDQIMEALAAAHDAAVQMIDTSIVRVHQHGACIANNSGQRIGLSRRADQQGPCRCGRQWFAGATRPHRWLDTRQPALLCLVATPPSEGSVAGRSRLTTRTGLGHLSTNGARGRTSAQTQSQRPNLLQPLPLPRPQPGRPVLQQDQAVPARRDPIRQARCQLSRLRQARLYPFMAARL